MPVSTRTCIGCRKRGPAAEMVRLARVIGTGKTGKTGKTGTIQVASPRRGPGRGASLHPRAACIEGALRPGVLSRAFKQPVDVSSESARLLRGLGSLGPLGN